MAIVAGLAAAGLVASNTQAQVPNVFSDGNVALAAEINENFDYLDAKLKEAANVGEGTTVDCDADANALIDALDAGYTNIEISQGTCKLQYLWQRTVSIAGATGANDELLAGIDTTPGSLVLEQSSVWLDSLNVQGAIFPSLTSFQFGNVNIDCSVVSNPDTSNAIYAYMSNGYIYESTVSDCRGVYIEGGSNLYIVNTTVSPRSEASALGVASDSAIMSYGNEYLATSSSEQWQMYVDGDAIFSGDLINGGIYMPRARVSLDGVTLADNGSGIIDLAPHFGGVLRIDGGTYDNTRIGTFMGGAVHVSHDPDNDHDNVEYSIDGSGQLSFGGAFTGTGNSVYAAQGSLINLGSWEAGGAAVANTVDVELGFSSFLTVSPEVSGSSAQCRDGLDLVGYSDGQTCVVPSTP